MQHQNRSNENHFKRDKIEKKDKVKRLCANLQKFIFEAWRNFLLASLIITIISGRDRSTRNKEL